jgi:hypothetical protein
MYNITEMDAELSTLGDLIYSGFNGELLNSYLIIIDNFINDPINITSFYSITGTYLPDMEVTWFSVSEEGNLKSELKTIIIT